MPLYVESPPVNGTFGQGSHMYLVLSPVDTTPTDWWVIRGGPSNGGGSPLEGQIDVSLQESFDAYPPADPWGNERGRTWIDLPQDATAWNSMVTIAESIISQEYAYNSFPRLTGGFSEAEAHLWVALNSNSFVTSIMYHMGIDPEVHMPNNLGVTPGDNTLLDIAGGHTLSADDWFSDIFAGGGADTVNGDSNQNYLFGGSGQDTLNGGGGDGILSGGPNADILNGNDGNDILSGNDAGVDTLRGGAGVDKRYGSDGSGRFDFDSSDESGSTGGSADKMWNFEVGIDNIDVASIDADAGVSGNQSFAFIGEVEFSAPAKCVSPSTARH